MGDATCDECLMDFYIPTYILDPKAERKQVPSKEPPSCPVIVFVNSKSGGQLGGELLLTYSSILNKNQVFDLGVNAPAKVLHTLYANLEKLKRDGDNYASAVYNRLRIIVAGGDGTASWILGVISDLKLPHSPPVAPVPLGTGNNLPFSFGWGKKNPGTDQRSVEAFLGLVKTANEMKVDSWHIRLKIPKQRSRDSVEPLELPNSLHAVRCISKGDTGDSEKYQIFQGGFWNYFSIGMDAKVSYAFHAERKQNPEKFKNQLSNQGTYLKLGCKEGGFSSSLFCSSSSCNISQQTTVKVMKKNGQHWEELIVPSSIRSIICLNLPSFSGGFNPWGRPTRKRSLDRGFTSPYVDDGLIEVVGFRDAWHGLVLLAPYGHGTRLAQTNRVRLEFHKGSADHTYMRIDGEPWKQPLPSNNKNVVIEISHSGQVNMLCRPPCRSRSVNDPYNSPRSGEDGSDEDDSCEERRKMGAAVSFKILDEIEADISQLS